MSTDQLGRAFREAWVAGVIQHYPGEPKSSYTATWEATPEWERDAAATVAAMIETFVGATNGSTSKLSREQRGRFVSLCWIGQIFKHFGDPKASYVADWDDQPRWQQETNCDIFERIERDLLSRQATS